MSFCWSDVCFCLQAGVKAWEEDLDRRPPDVKESGAGERIPGEIGCSVFFVEASSCTMLQVHAWPLALIA